MAAPRRTSRGLITTVGGGVRLRDPFVLFLRDCVAAALKATERCALLVARFGFEASGDVVAGGSVTLTPQDFPQVLAGQEILCWLNPSELGRRGARRRQRRRGCARGASCRPGSRRAAGQTGQTLTWRVATASYPADGSTIDDLLESLGRTLGTRRRGRGSASRRIDRWRRPCDAGRAR
jgi:hypothetical protein